MPELKVRTVCKNSSDMIMLHTANGSDPPKKRIGLLIGGSGLIGGTLSHYFKTHTPNTIELRAPSSKKLSIRNAEDIKTYLRNLRPDFIINCAIAALDSDAQLAFEVNYLGTVNLARAACAMGIPYIHMGSAAVLPNGEDLTEEDQLPLVPVMSNYAKSKLMAERSLAYMGRVHGLDYTIVRLAIVYGEHDHKIQGFHRLLFTVADESMPFMITRKGIRHSYTNANKVPYLVHHMLDHRDEFTGQTIHFVDRDPVELADLILTIRSYLELSRPREAYIPYPVILGGKYFLEQIAHMLNWFGITVRLPAELLFLESFYQNQTLSSEKLRRSSFVDPFPGQNIYTALPSLVIYYLTRWGHLNLITTFNDEYFGHNELEEDFLRGPQALLETVNADSSAPFADLLGLDTPSRPA